MTAALPSFSSLVSNGHQVFPGVHAWDASSSPLAVELCCCPRPFFAVAVGVQDSFIAWNTRTPLLFRNVGWAIERLKDPSISVFFRSVWDPSFFNFGLSITFFLALVLMIDLHGGWTFRRKIWISFFLFFYLLYYYYYFFFIFIYIIKLMSLLELYISHWLLISWCHL